jgi:hypothetical protein
MENPMIFLAAARFDLQNIVFFFTMIKNPSPPTREMVLAKLILHYAKFLLTSGHLIEYGKNHNDIFL